MESALLPCTSFTLFPELPSEMRLKVWRHTFPGPRVVGISHTFRESSFSGWRTLDPPPLVLQITHESREEALKYYKLSFGTALDPPKIYFNFQIDTLRFGHGLGEAFLNDLRWAEQGSSGYLLNLFLGTTFPIRPELRPAASGWDNLRSLIIDADEQIFGRRSFCWNEIRRFERLEEVTLLAWEAEGLGVDELLTMFQAALTVVAESHPEWKVPKITVMSALTHKEWGSLKSEPVKELEA